MNEVQAELDAMSEECTRLRNILEQNFKGEQMRSRDSELEAYRHELMQKDNIIAQMQADNTSIAQACNEKDEIIDSLKKEKDDVLHKSEKQKKASSSINKYKKQIRDKEKEIARLKGDVKTLKSNNSKAKNVLEKQAESKEAEIQRLKRELDRAKMHKQQVQYIQAPSRSAEELFSKNASKSEEVKSEVVKSDVDKPAETNVDIPIEEVVEDQSEEEQAIDDEIENQKTEQPSSVHEQIEDEKEDDKESEISQLTSVRNDKQPSGDDLILSKFSGAVEPKETPKRKITIKDINELKSPIMQLKCKMHDNNYMNSQDFINQYLFNNLNQNPISLTDLDQKLKNYWNYSKPEEISDLALFLWKSKNSNNQNIEKSKLNDMFDEHIKYQPFSKDCKGNICTHLSYDEVFSFKLIYEYDVCMCKSNHCITFNFISISLIKLQIYA